MSQANTFENRVRRLGRRHSRMYDNGIVRKMDKTGLISAYPRRRLPRFPLRGIAILFLAALLYKAFLLASLGTTVYQNRVDLLASGSFIEQGGAWVMQADPATRAVADFIRPFLPNP